MKKKEIKEIRKRLVLSVEKALTANNKNLIKTLEKNLKKSMKGLAINKPLRDLNSLQPIVTDE
jgi:hypothetical protein